MGTKTPSFAVGVIAIHLLVLPAGLAAKERRGAEIVITRTDGQLLEGELIAAGNRSIVLRMSEGAKDLSIGVADIEKIRIVKKSRALVGALSGMGLLGGLLVINGPMTTEEEAGVPALIFLGGLAGAAAGALAGLDRTILIAGESEKDLAAVLAKLDARSREGRARARPPSGGGPRLRLHLALSRLMPLETSLGGGGQFRFPEEAAIEVGPYGMGLSLNRISIEDAVAGPFSLACEWGEHWAAEIEYSYLGRTNIQPYGLMPFTSSYDGLRYQGSFWAESRLRLSAVVAGVAYRPVTPDVSQRHAIEIGAAVGPAFLRGQDAALGGETFSFPAFRKTVLCGRIKAAYDYYFSPGLSVGAFAGYRYLEAEATGAECSGTGRFSVLGTEEPPILDRPTVVALPEIGLNASGAYWGLRIGFRI